MLIALLMTVQASQMSEKPRSLLAFEAARRAIVGGEFRFSVQDPHLPGRVLNYAARYATNGDCIFEEHGDAEGWTRFRLDQKTGNYVPQWKLPSYYMQNDDGCWRWLATTISVQVWKRKPDFGWDPFVKDIRTVGMTPFGRELFKGTGEMWGGSDEDTRIVEWREEKDGPRYRVTGRTKHARYVWVLNAERGWNAERISCYEKRGSKERLVADCQTELRCTDGVWLPEVTTYVDEDGGETKIIVSSARINPAGAPRHFTPTDLGLEVGCQIAPQDFGLKPGERGPILWAGDRMVALDEWNELLRAGLKRGPIAEGVLRGEFSPLYTEEQRALLAQPVVAPEMAFLSPHLSAWRQYVEEFVKKFALEDEQKQKALVILAECEAKARAYVEKNRREFEETLNRTTTQPGESEALRVALMRPVDEIFMKDLCPRLDRLPTRSQKRAAAEAPKPDRERSRPKQP